MTNERAARLGHPRAFGARMLAMAALGLVLVAALTAATVSMLWPSTEPFYAARVTDLEPLEPRHFPNERFWLVLLEDGEVRAFHDRDPRRSACPLRWESPGYLERRGRYYQLQQYPDGAFRADCSGSVFLPDGAGSLYFGPSPRNLDQYEVDVREGHVYVDLSRVIEGASRVR